MTVTFTTAIDRDVATSFGVTSSTEKVKSADRVRSLNRINADDKAITPNNIIGPLITELISKRLTDYRDRAYRRFRSLRPNGAA